MCDKIELFIPAKAENISIARLTTSAVCMKHGFSIDDIEDTKLCVGEACNIILEKSNSRDIENIKIKFDVDEDMKISIQSKLGKIDENLHNASEEKSESKNYPLMIIETLMDELNFVENNEGIFIEMKKEMR